MKTAMTSLFRVAAFGMLAAVLTVGNIGCSQDEGKPADKKASAKKGETDKLARNKVNRQQSNSATKQQRETKQQAVAKQTQKRTAKNPRATRDVVAKTSSVNTPQDVSEDLPPIGDDVDQRRQHYANVIYATIRIRMEEAIQRRATLLDQGTNSTDPKVRNLENQIQKARQLLMENGETVDPVYPPIN